MNKGYAAALAVAAVAVLATGTLLGPRPQRPKAPDPAPPQPAPVRGSEMRQMSDFLASRARSATEHVVWVASAQATGLVWTDGQIVTVGTPPTVVRTASVATEAQTQPVTLAPLARFDQGGWIVIVARNGEGGAISASGLLGGVAPVRCGSEAVQKLLFNVPLEAAYAGAGVFGMSGNLIGMVVPCGDRWTAVTHDSVLRMLQTQLGPDAIAWHEFGVRTREPSDEEKKLLRLPDEGVFVAEVRRASTAANIGIRPGDLVLVTRGEELLSTQNELTVIRRGRRIKLQTPPPYSLERLEGAVLTSVQPDTPLAVAGLQPGDRLLNPEVLSVRGPKWLVYERDDRQIGTLLQ